MDTSDMEVEMKEEQGSMNSDVVQMAFQKNQDWISDTNTILRSNRKSKKAIVWDLDQDKENNDDVTDQSSNIPILKHINDVCKTNTNSKKYEVVKDISLDDVIAERKILDVPKQTRRRNKFARDFPTDNINLSLEEMIHTKSRLRLNNDRSKIEQSLEEIIQEENCKKQQRSTSKYGHHRAEEFIDFEMNGDANEDTTGQGRKRKRDTDSVRDDPMTFTLAPLDVILQLSEEGLIVEQEVGKQVDTSDGRLYNWQVKYKCGTISVTCQSARKMLAKQGAAKELIKEMKRTKVEDMHTVLPECKIPEACFYDPVVCERLAEQTKMMEIGVPEYKFTQDRQCGRDYFTTTILIAEDEYIGCAFKIDDSKILAAKGAYEVYAGKPFPRDRFFIGDDCNSDKEYVCKETAATHILTLRQKVVPNDFTYENEGSFGMPDMDPMNDEEYFVDDEGRMFIRSAEGSNKMRQLTKVAIEEIIENKLLELAGVGGDADTNFDD